MGNTGTQDQPVSSGSTLTLGASQGANFTAAGGTLYPITANATCTLPAGAPVGTQVGIYNAALGGANATLAANAGATINGLASIEITHASAAYGAQPLLIVQLMSANAWLVTNAFGTDGGVGANFAGVSAFGSLKNFGLIDIQSGGLEVAEGANAKQGLTTLTAGTVTVGNSSITANSRIHLTAQDNNSTGALRVSARVINTSFTITSSNAADNGNVTYEIFEPG